MESLSRSSKAPHLAWPFPETGWLRFVEPVLAYGSREWLWGREGRARICAQHGDAGRLLPKSGQLRSNSPKCIRIRAELCRNWTETGRIVSNSGQILDRLRQHRPNLNGSGEMLAEFDRHWADWLISTTFGANSTNICSESAKIGMESANVGLHSMRRTLAELDKIWSPNRPTLTQYRRLMARNRPNLARLRSSLARTQQMSVRRVPLSANTCPETAKLAPEFARILPRFVQIWATRGGGAMIMKLLWSKVVYLPRVGSGSCHYW